MKSFVRKTVGVWSPNPSVKGFGNQTPTIKSYNLFRIVIVSTYEDEIIILEPKIIQNY